jgi:hypothetical protein
MHATQLDMESNPLQPLAIFTNPEVMQLLDGCANYCGSTKQNSLVWGAKESSMRGMEI